MQEERVMHREKPGQLLNIPNVLTILRLILSPAVCYLITQDWMMPALALFVLASVTDIVDGYIARKYSLITDFGKLMDPLADKLMVITVMVALTVKGITPLPAVVILVIKELLMLIGAFLLYKKDVVVYSEPIGKVAQFVTVTALILCFFHEHLTARGCPVHLWLLWTGVALTLAALFYYAKHNYFTRFRPEGNGGER
jgi:cardiolipin synthase